MGQRESFCLQKTELQEALLWVETNQSTIPLAVYRVVLMVVQLNAQLEVTKQRASNLLALFRRAIGVEPKSERGEKTDTEKNPKPAKTDVEKLAALKTRRKKLLAEIRRYEDRLGKSRKKRQKKDPAFLSLKARAEESEKRAEPKFQRSAETVFTGNLALASEEARPLKVDRLEKFENPKGLHSVSDDRTRYEYGVTTKTIHLKVETVTDLRTGQSVTASTDEIGPPNSQATWAAIANTIIAVIGYAIPINRLALMLQASCPYFTSQRICFYLKMAAELFQPIYNYLGEDQLPECDVLQGDDTKVRVIEIQKRLKNGGTLDEPIEDSLVAKVAKVFGRVFDKKRGSGKKRSLNVSVVIGKTCVEDPRSYIFFFRSHLGTFGDLLTKMLETRSPKRKQLTILSDLATTNLVSTELYNKFEITHAGCGPHARRPFWRHKDKDQRLCYWMLSAFLVLEQIEDRIDELGRTGGRITRYRHRYAKKVWAAIKKRCESVIRQEAVYGYVWPKTSELYIACQYILKHYGALTRYLDDPRLPSNNNLSERVLRWDKIMEDASKFRMTEAGRLHVDILRTIVHTCSAASVELKDYLLFVFKNRDAIAHEPSKYTPYAYALSLDAAAAAAAK
jgi:Transposase IS66 family